jgi:hypothetical protein
MLEFEKSNSQVRQEILEMKARLNLDKLEQDLKNLKAYNS